MQACALGGFWPVQKESATAEPVLDMHVTTRICTPPPHVREQLLHEEPWYE